MYDINKLKKGLNQRFPFLFVDRVLEHHLHESILTMKCISSNEHWTVGHFDGNPIYPGALIIETMAQSGGLVFYDFEGESGPNKEGENLLVAVNKCKFFRKVIPGDVLLCRCQCLAKVGLSAKVACEVFVGDEKVAQSELSFIIHV